VRPWEKVLLALIIIATILLIPFELPGNDVSGPSLNETGEFDYNKDSSNATIEKCEELDPLDRNFCIDSVAERANRMEWCDLIDDEEIRTFCIARISLNETMCGEVVDEGLRDSCLKSIEVKKDFLIRHNKTV